MDTTYTITVTVLALVSVGLGSLMLHYYNRMCHYRRAANQALADLHKADSALGDLECSHDALIARVDSMQDRMRDATEIAEIGRRHMLQALSAVESLGYTVEFVDGGIALHPHGEGSIRIVQTEVH